MWKMLFCVGFYSIIGLFCVGVNQFSALAAKIIMAAPYDAHYSILYCDEYILRIGAFLIEFFLDTVSLPHKPFCAVRQYGK